MRAKNVARFDHRFHGWVVSVRRGGRRYYKYFSDSRHGGRRGSFKAAVRYRDGVDRAAEAYAHAHKMIRRDAMLGQQVVCEGKRVVDQCGGVRGYDFVVNGGVGMAVQIDQRRAQAEAADV